MSEEPPLIVQDGSVPYGAPVIDLAEVRIRFGVPNRKIAKPCEHSNLIYSREERRVWCEDCSRTIDNFDAFLKFTTHFHAMIREVNWRLEKAKEALASTITRRATKKIDRAWSGNQMAICCPHCSAGLLPEDFERGLAQISGEIERARRARMKANAPSNKEGG